MIKGIEGFSKLTKNEKIDWIVGNHFKIPEEARSKLISYWNSDNKIQKNHDEFIENTISNFYFPLGVAPNFIINNEPYTLPMVTEESSVIAAASKAAKFWAKRGGFHSEVLSTHKNGQIHFLFNGDNKKIQLFFKKIKKKLMNSIDSLTKKMKKRGGGLINLEIINKTNVLDDYYQLNAIFDTADAMGANFINSCLESLAETFKKLYYNNSSSFSSGENIEIVMSILSNYSPECLVYAKVSCPINEMIGHEKMKAEEFTKKFITAVKIANNDVSRAVTHNKGIMNGIDALAIATGNDFRAIEACAHAYACKSGQYRSLSNAYIDKNNFVFELKIPLSLGTVGGLTQLHPLVKWSSELLKFPDAKSLMQIIAVAGLAQNFAAVESLITSGIQKGHMKMHLLNILNQKGALEYQKVKAIEFFKTTTVSVSAVETFLKKYTK